MSWKRLQGTLSEPTGDTQNMDSWEKLRVLGAQLEDTHTKLESVYDDLGADYQSDAAKQFELQLQHETDPERTYDSWWIQNDRENIWHPTIGGKLPNHGEKLPWIITSYEESVQPAVRQAAKLLSKTRDASKVLATMSQDDLALLASVPVTLSKSVEVLGKASTSMESASNQIGTMRNSLIGSSWEGDGRDAYLDSLSPQIDAFEECQEVVEATSLAAMALANIIVDVVGTFLGVRKKQLEMIQNLSKLIFTLVNPGSWLDVAEKVHDSMVKAQTKHGDEFAKSLQDMADSAENHLVLESAERTAEMVWPTPLSEFEGTWSGSASAP